MSVCFLEREPGLQVIIDHPEYDLVVARDEHRIVADYDREAYCEAAEQGRDPDEVDDIIVNIGEAASAINAIAYYTVFGLSVEVPSPGYIRVIGPSNAELNKTRENLARATGIHTGEFMETDADFVGFLDFATLLAQRKIPMSMSNTLYVTHDNVFHRLGYSKMCEVIFDRFVAAAQVAVEANDATFAEEVITAFDYLSGAMAYNKDASDEKFMNRLVLYYKKFMHPLAAGILAATDAQAQFETDQKLQQLALAA